MTRPNLRTHQWLYLIVWLILAPVFLIGLLLPLEARTTILIQLLWLTIPHIISTQCRESTELHDRIHGLEDRIRLLERITTKGPQQ